MNLIERNNSTGSARNAKALPGPWTRALSPRGNRLALLAAVVLATVLATVLAGLALRRAGRRPRRAEPWSGDRRLWVTSVSIGAGQRRPLHQYRRQRRPAVKAVVPHAGREPAPGLSGRGSRRPRTTPCRWATLSLSSRSSSGPALQVDRRGVGWEDAS